MLRPGWAGATVPDSDLPLALSVIRAGLVDRRRPPPLRRLESVATGELPMRRIEREVGLDRVRAAAATADDALLPLDQQQLEVLAGSHGHLRPAVHALLAAIALAAAPADRALPDAIAAIDRAHRDHASGARRTRRFSVEVRLSINDRF